MRKIRYILIRLLLILSVIAILLVAILYISQEKLLFYPEKINKNYQFSFNYPFEEVYFKMHDGVRLHGLFFKADSSKGVIYYLHGNAGSVKTWGTIAEIYTSLNYDLLILDYRGFGKSQGKIVSEKQMYRDAQNVYDILNEDYAEDKIVVLGYSIGTGMAAMLASMNKPKQLFLLAPYYNLPDLVKQIYPIVPGFILKYKFKTNDFIPNISVPVTIFHGKKDELISYRSSERLFELCKPDDKLFLLENQPHNGINENLIFQNEVKKILEP